MLTALAVLFWLIVGFLALILVLGCIPLHLKMTARSEPIPAFSLEFRLLSGSAPRLFLVESGRFRARSKKSQRQPEKPRRHRKKQKTVSRWTSRVRPVELVGDIPALLVDTLSGIHIDRMRLEMEFGFEDPADTGRVFGQLVPLAYLPISPAVSLDVKPNFENPCLRGNADAALHFIPVRLAVPAVRFAWWQFVVRS